MMLFYKIEEWESAKWTETGPLQDFQIILIYFVFHRLFYLKEKK